MPISFATPEFLLLLVVLLPLVILLGRRSLAGLDKVRRRMALTLGILLVVLAVAHPERLNICSLLANCWLTMIVRMP